MEGFCFPPNPLFTFLQIGERERERERERNMKFKFYFYNSKFEIISFNFSLLAEQHEKWKKNLVFHCLPPPPPPPHFAKHSGSVIITFLNTDGTKKNWLDAIFRERKICYSFRGKTTNFHMFYRVATNIGSIDYKQNRVTWEEQDFFNNSTDLYGVKNLNIGYFC